jgi:hypothetical protein
MTRSSEAPLDARGQYIAPRKRDVFAALLADLGLVGSEPAERLYQLVTATVHYGYLAELERLHEAYYHLDPGRSGPAPTDLEGDYAALEDGLERVLKGANFVEVTPEELERASNEGGRIVNPVRTGVADFRAIRMFRRGSHNEELERKSWFGLRKKKLTIEVYDEVVIYAALKENPPETGKKWQKRRRRPVRPGSVMIKCFHNIASADLEALYPGVRVVMTTRDKLMFGLPALVAGIPLLIKLAPAAIVIYGLLRFYLGDREPGSTGIGEALIVATGFMALGGFLMNQWVKFERRSLLYQQQVNDTIYFHNVTNNVGIFDYIIGVAEEQECKEMLLAYFLLLTAGTPLSKAELDHAVEAWLARCLGVSVDFDVEDAVAKLERYGLLVRQGERLAVVPMPDALSELDRRWDGVFQFADVA